MAQNASLETLQEIRSLMERSTRFISLSGWSGVSAGAAALAGACAAFVYTRKTPFVESSVFAEKTGLWEAGPWGLSYGAFFLLDAFLVLLLALAGAIYFTTRKAQKKGLPIWDPLTRRLLVSLFLPLCVGGVFTLGLLYHHAVGLVAPATLVFYGLALINASKFTFDDLRLLGISEALLGLIALFWIGLGLEFWALGFGVLHIAYGIRMYWKYDRVHAA
ncbi:MAG: hypothetical protein KIPDCIKN_04043 [Haliscomenobacter sp.]|jgi:hypothetical protein|nr:hypothetical protein [Haliscomenobacter sp.]